MGSRPTTSDIIRLHATIRGADETIRDMDRERCLRSVKAWNELIRRFQDYNPSTTIGAANVTGYHWLKIYCGGCRQVTHLDLRTVADRYHPVTHVTFVASRLVCTRCGRDGPMPQLHGLTNSPPQTATSYHLRKQAERFDE